MPEAQSTTTQAETHLPKQVQAAADLARKIEAQLKATSQQPAAQPAAPEAQPAAASTEPETTDDTPTVISKSDPRYNDPQYWLKRGHTINGMLSAQAARHQAELSRSSAQVGELQQQLADAQRQLREVTAKPVTPADLLSQEQIDLLGPEQANAIVTMMTKHIKDQVSSLIAAEIKPLQEQRAKDDKARIEKANADFFKAIRKDVPQFDALNSDPAFIEYFHNTIDPKTGQTLAEISRAAEARLDPAPCIAILKGYLGAQKIVQPSVPVSEPTIVTSSASMPTGDASAPAGGPVYTATQIANKYSLLARRKAPDAEVKAWDAEVKKAQAEGRIRGK